MHKKHFYGIKNIIIFQMDQIEIALTSVAQLVGHRSAQ